MVLRLLRFLWISSSLLGSGQPDTAGLATARTVRLVLVGQLGHLNPMRFGAVRTFKRAFGRLPLTARAAKAPRAICARMPHSYWDTGRYAAHSSAARTCRTEYEKRDMTARWLRGTRPVGQARLFTKDRGTG